MYAVATTYMTSGLKLASVAEKNKCSIIIQIHGVPGLDLKWIIHNTLPYLYNGQYKAKFMSEPTWNT